MDELSKENNVDHQDKENGSNVKVVEEKILDPRIKKIREVTLRPIRYSENE